MCGIVGMFVEDEGPEVDPDLLRRMTSRLRHRGPDDDGFHLEPSVGLGFRRLSIIDVEGGHQPLYNEDRQVAVIFNGEIYNFRELRKELEAAGHRFATASDSEVLVHGWEVWGEAMVPRLRGMFAFAIWDRRLRRLFLARDRLGIKPLYYGTVGRRTWIFASELKALLVHPGLTREIDPQAVEDYFTVGYVPEPRSILTAVAKLPPAHTLTLGKGARGAPVRYWDVRFDAGPRVDPAPAAVEEELLATLDDCVASHLVSDVPLGAFLSGGIDSSAVVSSMARQVDGAVRTCSISFGEERFDEGPFAAEVAALYRTDHSQERAGAEGFRLLDRLTEAYDEPFSDNSSLPTYLLCRLARSRVKVALSGDGGDETLAGYGRYRRFLSAVRTQTALPGRLRRPLLGVAASLAGRAGSATLPDLLRSLRGDLPEAYARLVGISGPDTRDRLFTAQHRRERQGYRTVDLLRRLYEEAPAGDPLSRVQYVDLRTYLPGEILTKVDRASMAHSLEVRVPLLDHRWVEWAATVPVSLRIRGGEGKHILRRALRRRLPAAILARRKKGFSVPVAAWLRGPLREELRGRLLGPGPGRTGILDPPAISRLVTEHLDGKRDHGSLLWALIFFQSSLDRLTGG